MSPNDTPSRGAAVPVPPVGPRAGNRFPEPPGTAGTALFEPLAAFLARTKDLPQLSWLIEGVVPDSGNLLIVAAPGAGKTFLAFVIAKTAAEANRHVFLVLEEGRPRSMYDRFSALGFRPDAPIHIAHRKGVKFGDDAALKRIAENLRTHEAPVLILDPFSSLFLGDENDTGAVNEAKEHVQALATVNPRALIVLVHHTSKAGERGDGPPIYAGRGSTVLPGWADVQVNLARENTPHGAGLVGFVAQVAKGRDGETAQRYRFTLSLRGGTVVIEDVSEAATQDKAGEVREVLASAGKPLTKTQIAKRMRGRSQDKFQAIKAMEKQGKLKPEGEGYVLAPDTATERASEQGG